MEKKNCAIGVIGFSRKFDITTEQRCKTILSEIFDRIAKEHEGAFSVISGLTAIGVPKCAYELATENNWKTVGVACAKAEEYDCYPCDEKIIVGKDWGDESECFLSKLDILVRVGGGPQSLEECATFKRNGRAVIEQEFQL